MKRNKRTEGGSCINSSQKTLSIHDEPWLEKYLMRSATEHLMYTRAHNKEMAALIGFKDIKPPTAREIILANRKFLRDISARRRSSVRAEGACEASVSDCIQSQLSQDAAASTKPIKGRIGQCRRRRVRLQGPKFDFITIDQAPMSKKSLKELLHKIGHDFTNQQLKEFFKFKV